MSVIRPNAEPPVTAVAAGDIFLIDGPTSVRALAATSVVLRDANGNVQLNNVVEGFTSTATAGGTTTLTVMSAANQFFTGTTTQTVILPVTSTLALGQGYFFQNSSTGAVTIQSSGGNAVKIIAPGAFAIVTCIALTGTSAASWQATYFADIVVSGKVLAVSNSLTLAGTDGTTQTFPATSATLARTDAAQTFTGTQTFGALVATTVNGNTVTAGTGVLTIAAAKTLTANNSLTLAGVDGKTLTVNNSVTLAGTDGTTLTFQGTDTYIGRATTDTLTNKTFDTAGTGNVFKVNGTAVTAIAAANGLATLDGSGKLTAAQIPASLVGALQYQGVWNASTNTPTLVSSTGTKGQYYKVSVAGTTTIDTISQWNVGDMIVFDGTTWDKIDGIANEVVSVAGLTGVVTLAASNLTNGVTGSGAVVLATSPTLTGTTTIGTLAATTINGAALSGTFSGTPALSGANFITNANLVQAGAATLKMNATAATANETASTIQGLVNLASPSGTLDFVPIFDHVSGTIKNATPNALAAAGTAGVTLIAGNAGAFTLSHGLTNATNDLQIDIGTQRGYLSGLTLSTAGSSATFGVAAGVAVDSTNADFMKLTSAFTKTTSPWAVGNGNGGLDVTGLTAAWYHVYQIKRPDTGVVDICFSLSATAPTFGSNIPAAYTLFRRIGAMLVNGSAQWVAFSQLGDEFLWRAPVNVANGGTVPTSATLLSLAAGCPTGVQVTARMRGFGNGATSNGILFQSPDETSAVGNATSGNLDIIWGGASQSGGNILVRTDTSAEVRWSAAASGATGQFVAYGWIDRRGRDL
jgi:hypothetical protein